MRQSVPAAACSRLVLALGIAGTFSSPALALPETADEQSEGREQNVVVVGERESEAGYRVSRSTSGMRTDTPLIDTPQTVSVVTVRQIEDQAANSIGDAIRYTPGVFSTQGEGNRETLVLRGMTTTGDFFVDGIRDDVQTYRDLYNIDRLEIFRGPNAMIFGRGGTGGLVNRVTKAPGWTPVRGFRLEAGMDDHYRGSFDIGGPLGTSVAMRLTGVYQNSGSYRDGVDYERWGINPTLALRIGPDTLVQLGYEHFEDDRIADRGVPSQVRPAGFTGAAEAVVTRRSTFFGDPERSPTYTDTDAFNVYVTHDFGGVTIRNRTRYADYDKFYQNVFPGAVNATTVVNPAGLASGSYAPGTIVQIQAYNNATERRNLINQTDLNAEFSTGGIGHTLLVGAEFGRQETDNLRLDGFFPVPGNPDGVQTIFAAAAQPEISRPDLLFRPLASSGDNFGRVDIAAAYVQDQIRLSPQLELVLGLRFEHLVTEVTDRRTVGFPAGGQREFRVTDNLWSPRAGLIFKPAENASLYASYSRAYLPRGGDQLSGLNLSNAALAPELYSNYEIGAKWDPAAALSLTLALYQLDRSNVIVLVDPNNPGAGTELGGGQRSRGLEMSAVGQVSEQLSIAAAYTYQEAEFTRAVSATVQEGAEIPNAPRHSASLWARYDLAPGFGLALGGAFRGRRFAAQDNLVRMPGYVRIDAAAFYRINSRLDLQLNVENILNEEYFPYAHTNNNITPGGPTTARLALNARF